MAGGHHTSNGEVDPSGAEVSDSSDSNGYSNVHVDGNIADEKGYEDDQGQPTPVGFWNSGLRKTRNGVFRSWGIMTLILCCFIFAVLSLYWGALYHVEANLPSLGVFVVDFDGQVAPYNTGETPIVGPQITQAVEMQLSSPEPHLGYITMPPSDFDNDPMQVRQAVYDYKAWAAIIINPNATAMLMQAIQTGNTTYQPMGAAQMIYVEARDETSNDDYIIPQLLQLQSQITTMFGEMWTGMVLEQAANNQTLMANLQAVPQALSPGIGFSIYNLRPFYPPVATPAVSIGLIYLIIISFFSFSFYMPIHTRFLDSKKHPPLKFWQLIVWRWVANMFAYLFLSLFYSLISLAFMIPFSHSRQPETEVAPNTNAYGKASFVVYWMLNWVGMIALGLACENVAMVIGFPWTAMWLIFWVITNVSTSFYEITLAPRFYFWGYAWPLRNIVEGSRTIIFDVHSRIGLNFGILFAWCAVNTTLFPLCSMFMRWKTMREQKGKSD
ncbi:MAG: rRNA-processing protein bfr2 [Chaenotheca gracillima]|nr:MAG: rRNA-processing protein bfr2 [Chaenotheca gracillima]